ncbi:hypothetical protein NLX83_39025 [Allokutzneria sp. A3M-2-11 16]|uniref:hypothetical protein n=1 Tax=Allokutzneria sp. A3M-2-11 16 TaxID=2962043 RepID=UPI0020B69904|nr:hypothetical protein [Allokutzneria sp. A3M-2-11 16]MCP3805276.1 hypothetical protein [Allokutzneria sp. A3M-2-11 16]
MEIEVLRRTRKLSVALTALLGMWFFGNLYEQIVWNPQLLADPRPGSLVGELAWGSPVFYYLPWVPITFIAAAALRVRFGAAVPAGVRRAWNLGLGALAVGLAIKVVLVTRVNPVFRDAAATSAQVHDNAVVWAFANGVVVLAVAAALYFFTAWRRV